MTDPARADYRLRSRPNVIFGEADSRRVWVDEVELTPEESWTYRIHSPDGFQWGYSGSGLSQLGLGHPTHDRRQGVQLAELPELQVRVPGQAVARQRFVDPTEERDRLRRCLQYQCSMELSFTCISWKISNTSRYMSMPSIKMMK